MVRDSMYQNGRVNSALLTINVFAEDTYTKVESIEGQDIRVKIMDTCDNVSRLYSV